MKSCVIPTVFARNRKEFDSRLKKILPLSSNIQIDFMDGKLVHSKGILPKDIPSLNKYKKNFEAHLMCVHPEIYIDELAEKGFKKTIVHYEAFSGSKQVETLLKFIRGNEMEAWIAVNPETELWEVVPYAHMADGVLFMGVHPGKEGQKFVVSILEKIKTLRGMYSSLKIQVDGGVNPENAQSIRKSGVNSINSGSFVAKAKSPKIAINKLNKVFTRD